MKTDESSVASDRRSRDALATLIAALIGGMALLVSGYTAYIQRQQVRAQVWPFLLVGNYDPEQTVGVLNKGVGPAIVRSVQVWVDGQPQRDWKHVLAALGLPTTGIVISTIAGNVISAGERVAAIKIDDESAYRGFRDAFGTRIGIEICFCSTLEECRLYSDRGSGGHAVQTAIERCPALTSAQAFAD